MAVQDFTTGDGYELPNNASGQLFALKCRIDTATTNVTSGNVAKAFIIPADTVVREVILIVRTAEGGTLTVDVGDYLIATDAAVTADGYLDGVNCNATAGTAYNSLSSDDTYGGGGGTNGYGKVYTSRNSYIGVLFNNTADAAIVDVIALCCDISGNAVSNTY